MYSKIHTIELVTHVQSSLRHQLVQKLLYSFLHAGYLPSQLSDVTFSLACLFLQHGFQHSDLFFAFLLHLHAGQGLLLVAVAAHSVVCSVPSVFHQVDETVQHPGLSVWPQEFDSLFASFLKVFLQFFLCSSHFCCIFRSRVAACCCCCSLCCVLCSLSFS